MSGLFSINTCDIIMTGVVSSNTYGLTSVNEHTFNQEYHGQLTYPKQARDVIVTGLRVQNLVLLVAGYTSRFKMIAGCARMVSGAAIGAVTLAIGDRNAGQGVIVGKWYDEALQTSGVQIARGLLEAFVPYGRIANLTFDIVATPINLLSSTRGSFACEECMSGGRGIPHVKPHEEPAYPFPLQLLYLV